MKPRSVPAGETEPSKDSATTADAAPSASSIFGGAKPVDTVTKDKEIEKKISKKSPVIARR